MKYSLDYFLGGKLSFALIKKDKILYKSKDQGIDPLIFCLRNQSRQLKRAEVFDKVVGRASALLLVCGGIKKIMTPTISQGALNLIRRHKIKIEYKNLVKQILNKKNNDICPMEKLSRGKNASQFLKALNK